MIALFTVNRVLHYGCAFTAVLLTALSLLIYIGQGKQIHVISQRRSRPITVCISLLSLLYVCEGVVVATKHDALLRYQAQIAYTVALSLLWTATWVQPDGALHLLLVKSFSIAIFEVLLLVFYHYEALQDRISQFQLACLVARVLVLAVLLVSTRRARILSRKPAEAEAQPFLNEENNRSADNGISYGTATYTVVPESEDGSDASDDEDDTRIKRLRAKRLEETGSWWAYLKDFTIFLPYLVPRQDRKVQLCYVVCICSLLGDRFLNVLVPIQLGLVADKLFQGSIPHESLAIWLLLSILNGDSGLQFIRTLVKIQIRQFSYREICNGAFAHVMSLGMDFHSERDSAEVMKTVEQGYALTNVLETFVLDVVPTVIDLIVAVFLLYSKINAYAALAMVVAAGAYLVLDIKASSWNKGNRRQMTKTERDEVKVMHQAVQGWTAVSYFNMLGYERHRYGDAVNTHLQADWKWSRRDACTDAALGLFVPLTFFCLACLIFLEISQGRASPGDFVFLIQYWERLIWPLESLSRQQRWLMADLIDAERLLDLLKTKPTITDSSTAVELATPIKGHVSFENVSFSYDQRKPIIQDVSFSVLPGETLAFVGATGAGKSSIIKLLMRFYDVDSGTISIDGHDIQHSITLSSLRDALGIVPQDPLLFNASIISNLRFAKLDASDAEIASACRAAAIHDKILSFPDGYNTIVGEHGVKLSGGEVQRLAIARVFLKDPPILILDEATSAVDTATEAEIQSVLGRLRRRRTTFVIAHRLSTIVGADRILVLHEGKVVERGDHRSLLALKGRYWELWRRQVEGVGGFKARGVVDLMGDGYGDGGARRPVSSG